MNAEQVGTDVNTNQDVETLAAATSAAVLQAIT